MDPDTLYAHSFAQRQALYLVDFQNNPHQAHENHAKFAEQLRRREKEEAEAHPHTQVSVTDDQHKLDPNALWKQLRQREEEEAETAPRSGFFQNDEAVRALNGENDDDATIDLTAKDGVQNMKKRYPTFVNGGANVAYSQNDRPRREQWVYVGQSEDVESLVNDQPLGIARSSVQDSTVSYDQDDQGSLGMRQNEGIEDTYNDIPVMDVQSRLSDWSSTASRSSSTLSYDRNDRGSLGLHLSTILEIKKRYHTFTYILYPSNFLLSRSTSGVSKC